MNREIRKDRGEGLETRHRALSVTSLRLTIRTGDRTHGGDREYYKTHNERVCVLCRAFIKVYVG